MKHKFTLSLITVFTSLTAFTFISNKQVIETSAAIDVITTNLTDSQVHAYYDGVSGLSGSDLKEELNVIISTNYVNYSYDSLWDISRIIDRDWELSPLVNTTNYNYTDTPYLNLLYGSYNGNSATAYDSSASHTTIMNREHTWPQSHGTFGRSAYAGSDFHHLRLADQNMNSAHSDLDFGYVASPVWNKTDERGVAYAKTGASIADGKTVFEPADEWKGDVARMLFYMATRYIHHIDSTKPQLRLVDTTTDTSVSSASVWGELGILKDLLEWNKLDPISDFEIKRNNLIHLNYQRNRNPYIDHPEWADIVFDTTYSGGGATIASGTSTVGSNPAWLADVSPLESISVSVGTARTSFNKNEPFNSDGLLVTANYEDGTSHIVRNFVTNPDKNTLLSTPGTLTVEVSYAEHSITKTGYYDIKVSTIERNLINLNLDTTAVQTTFAYGSEFNNDNVIVTAVYDNSTSEDVTLHSLITPADTFKLGSQSVHVSYGGKSATYDVLVTNQGTRGLSALADDLFISEYIEAGSGQVNRKAIEIYNGTGSAVTLKAYSLALYTNGAGAISNSLPLTGNLAQGGVWVVTHSSAEELLTKANQTSSSVINFNGNDAIALLKNGTVIDVIGVIGVDPGAGGWTGTPSGGNATGSTTDCTLVRNPAITSPNSTFDFSEWYSYSANTYSYLGTHTYNPVVGDGYMDQAQAYAIYFLEITGVYCEVLNGAAIPWSMLSSEYGFLVNEAKDYFVNLETTNEYIIDAHLRYVYLLTKYPTLASDNFMKSSSGSLYYSPLAYSSSETTPMSLFNNPAIFIIMGGLVVSICFFFVLIRRRNEN